MAAIIAIVCFAIFAIAGLVVFVMKTGPSQPVKQRLEALEQEPEDIQPEEVAPNIRRQEQFSGIGWLNRWMVNTSIAPRTRLLLDQADVTTPPRTLVMISITGCAAIAWLVYLRTEMWFPSLALGLVFVPAPLVYVFKKRAQRFAKIEQQLPEALEQLVSALQVGHSFITGIGALGQDATEPIAGEFRKLFDEQNFGLDLRTAMTNLATRVPLQDVRIFVAAALIQKESGGNLAEVLSNVAHTTRQRFRLKKQIMVHSAQGRLTGWILSLLPVVLGFGMYLVNPKGMSVLWTRPIGIKMLSGAAVMIVIGYFTIQKIVRIRV